MNTGVPRFEQLLAAIPLGWNPYDFVLCGSSILAVHGFRDVNDLDVLIRPSFWPEVEAINADGGWPREHPKHWEPAISDGEEYKEQHGKLFRTGAIDFFDRLPRIASCIEPDDVFTRSRLIEWPPLPAVPSRQVRVSHPRHVLAVKLLAFREKDTPDMEWLAQLVVEYGL